MPNRVLSKIKSFHVRYIKKVINSIAFYPTTVTLCMCILAVILVDIDNSDMKKLLDKHMPYLVINNADTARVILSTLIGGIISLTVFSFSMVMITLNQASANYSPRLLPGLISEKKNQFVLGFYLGTIIFNLIVLISILPSGKSNNLNVLSIIVGILLGVLCLAFFIYFIHNISSSIQINNILYKKFKDTCSNVDASYNDDAENLKAQITDVDNWHPIHAQEAGYYNGYNESGLLKMCEQNDMDIIIDIHIGQFVMNNYPILRTSRELQNEKVESILENLFFNQQNDLSSHYIFGINQITEVGIRSLSPGINDPATALITLDYLSVILAKRMKIRDFKISNRENESHRIQENRNSFCTILQNCFGLYRLYGKQDLMVMKKLLSILQHLHKQECADKSYLACIEKQIKTLQIDAKESISNEHDLEVFMNRCHL